MTKEKHFHRDVQQWLIALTQFPLPVSQYSLSHSLQSWIFLSHAGNNLYIPVSGLSFFLFFRPSIHPSIIMGIGRGGGGSRMRSCCSSCGELRIWIRNNNNCITHPDGDEDAEEEEVDGARWWCIKSSGYTRKRNSSISWRTITQDLLLFLCHLTIANK